MKLVRTSLTRVLIIVLSLSSLFFVYAQNAASQIKSEIARLEQSVNDHPISDPDLKSLAPMIADSLKSASDALNTGQLYLALEKLGQAEDLLQGARVAADKSEVEKGGLPAFESRWGNASIKLTALEKDAHARDWKKSPLAIRALAEAAQTRAIPLLEGGRGFATANGPKDGLFYVGQAEGEAELLNILRNVEGRGKSARISAALASSGVALSPGKNQRRVPAAEID